MPAPTLRYAFRLGPPDGGIEGALEIPAPRARLADLVPAACHLTELAGGLAARTEREEGRSISCRAGCGACCRQCVVVSIPEVLHVAALVQSLPPEHRDRVRARFDAIEADLADRGMIERLLDPEFRETPPHVPIVVEYFRLGHACPFLDEESCSIHPLRPVPCRDYSVTTPAELCRDPYANPVRKVPMPIALSAPLARLTAELTGEEPRLVPLSLALRWAGRHPDLGTRTWPSEALLGGLLRQIGSGDV